MADYMQDIILAQEAAANPLKNYAATKEAYDKLRAQALLQALQEEMALKRAREVANIEAANRLAVADKEAKSRLEVAGAQAGKYAELYREQLRADLIRRARDLNITLSGNETDQEIQDKINDKAVAVLDSLYSKLKEAQSRYARFYDSLTTPNNEDYAAATQVAIDSITSNARLKKLWPTWVKSKNIKSPVWNDIDNFLRLTEAGSNNPELTGAIGAVRRDVASELETRLQNRAENDVNKAKIRELAQNINDIEGRITRWQQSYPGAEALRTTRQIEMLQNRLAPSAQPPSMQPAPTQPTAQSDAEKAAALQGLNAAAQATGSTNVEPQVAVPAPVGGQGSGGAQPPQAGASGSPFAAITETGQKALSGVGSYAKGFMHGLPEAVQDAFQTAQAISGRPYRDAIAALVEKATGTKLPRPPEDVIIEKLRGLLGMDEYKKSLQQAPISEVVGYYAGKWLPTLLIPGAASRILKMLKGGGGTSAIQNAIKTAVKQGAETSAQRIAGVPPTIATSTEAAATEAAASTAGGRNILSPFVLKEGTTQVPPTVGHGAVRAGAAWQSPFVPKGSAAATDVTVSPSIIERPLKVQLIEPPPVSPQASGVSQAWYAPQITGQASPFVSGLQGGTVPLGLQSTMPVSTLQLTPGIAERIYSNAPIWYKYSPFVRGNIASTYYPMQGAAGILGATMIPDYLKDQNPFAAGLW